MGAFILHVSTSGPSELNAMTAASPQRLLIATFVSTIYLGSCSGYPSIDMHQCSQLHGAIATDASEKMSVALFSPIVQYELLRHGTLCVIHWPQRESCSGFRVAAASKSKPAVEVSCDYQQH